MNIKENIIIFEMDMVLKSKLTLLGAIPKEVEYNDGRKYGILSMIFEKKFVRDFGPKTYIRSWSDRYTETVLDNGEVIGLGILKECDATNYVFKDEKNYFKFGG